MTAFVCPKCNARCELEATDADVLALQCSNGHKALRMEPAEPGRVEVVVTFLLRADDHDQAQEHVAALANELRVQGIEVGMNALSYHDYAPKVL